MTARRAEPPIGPAHRLRLTATELTDLVRRTGVRLPPPFGVDGAAGTATADGAAGTATADGAPGNASGEGADGAAAGTASGEPVHPSVAANLGVLARPEVTVRTEASLRGGRSRAVFAVAGPLGASLFALAEGAVELSLFPAVALGRELIRAVPDSCAGGDAVRILAALGAGAPDDPRPAGRVDWAALAEFEPSRAFGGVPAMTPREAAAAADTAGRTHGILHCLVVGWAADAAVAVGQVVWIATDAGWVGLAPTVAGGRRVVELRPVDRADLGTWLAPYLAQILDDDSPPGGGRA